MAIEDKYLKEDNDVFMEDFMSGALSAHLGYDYADCCGSCRFHGISTYHGSLLTCANKNLFEMLGLKYGRVALITDTDRICKLFKRK